MSKSKKGRTKPGRQHVKSQKKKQAPKTSQRIRIPFDQLVTMSPSEQLDTLLNLGLDLETARLVMEELDDAAEHLPPLPVEESAPTVTQEFPVEDILDRSPAEQRDYLRQLGIPEQDLDRLIASFALLPEKIQEMQAKGENEFTVDLDDLPDSTTQATDLPEGDAMDSHNGPVRIGEFFAFVLFKTQTPDLAAIRERLSKDDIFSADVKKLKLEDSVLKPFGEHPALLIPLRDKEEEEILLATDGPIPPYFQEVIAQFSPFCKDSRALLSEHHSAVGVSMTIHQPASVVEYSRFFVLLLNAVLKDKAALAVCMHGSLRTKADYMEASMPTLKHKSFSAAPFVNINAVPEEDDESITIFTTGCRTFGHIEMEIRHLTSDEVPHRTAELMTVATHCLCHPKTLVEGDVWDDLGVTPFSVHTEMDIESGENPVLVLTPLEKEDESAQA